MKKVFAAAVFLAGHAMADEPPCPKVITREPMLVMDGSKGLMIGTAIVTYDYVAKSVCSRVAGNPDIGVTITPANKCWDIINKEATDDTHVIATSKAGGAIDLTPPVNVIMELYDDHRLVCRGVAPTRAEPA
jgi:hypothetical protein